MYWLFAGLLLLLTSIGLATWLLLYVVPVRGPDHFSMRTLFGLFGLIALLAAASLLSLSRVEAPAATAESRDNA